MNRASLQGTEGSKATQQGVEPLSEQEANELAGKLGFAADAAYGRIGRAFVRPIASAKRQAHTPISEQPEVLHALDWWEALLELGVFRLEPFRAPRRRCVVFPDGYWDQTTQQGGVGAILLTPEGTVAFGGMIPPHIKSQLAKSFGQFAESETSHEARRYIPAFCHKAWLTLTNGYHHSL